MERAIGDLGGEIRQPSNIYGNLCKIAFRQSQTNALKTLCPELNPTGGESILSILGGDASFSALETEEPFFCQTLYQKQYKIPLAVILLAVGVDCDCQMGKLHIADTRRTKVHDSLNISQGMSR